LLVSVANFIAEKIAQRGIRHAFGVPGGGVSLTLIDSLEHVGIQFHTVQHEGAAAVMAGTTGHLSGVAGVAISIKGPGLTNMVPGMALCHFESFPMVALAEAYPPGTPAFRAHKRMDQQTLTVACSKAQILLDDAGGAFDLAATIAESESPGPVLLELLDQPVGHVPARAEPVPDNRVLPRTVETCERPIVVVGALGQRLGLSGALNQLSVPVFSTAAAKGVVDETLPHSAGVFTGVGLEHTAEAKLFKKADYIVAIGLRAREMLGVAAFGVPVLAFDAIQDAGATEWKFGETLPPRLAPAALAQISDRQWGLDEVLQARKATTKALSNGAFLPAHVFAAIERHFGAERRVVLDTGNFCTVGEHLCMARRPNDVLLSGQGRYMGVGLPMAIASAMHDTARPTVLVVGDGGIGPWIGEIRLAVALKLPLLIIMVSDGGFSSIRGRALRDGLTLKPLSPANPSWLAVMAGFGLVGCEVTDIDSLAGAISTWCANDGPGYVEARFDATPYDAMTYGIR
jgi:acetolactate synthase-1/2/3 large subunit